MNRRVFLTGGAAGAFALLAGTRAAKAQPQNPAAVPNQADNPNFPYGETRLALADPDNDELEGVLREGVLYVPKSYKDGVPMPVLCMLHGLAGTSGSARFTYPLAEEFGVIVVAPESRRITWGKEIPGFDRDGNYIVEALRFVNRTLYMDPTHVAIGGVSDGATYAISMGLAYGDSFSHLMIFSEGIPVPYRKEGKPKIFIGHGNKDTQMPVDMTARASVPKLKAEGYDVTYVEYDGGHGAPAPVVRQAFEWFVGKSGQSK
jgi:phospholipase/carboxylesterase